jgi:hypothetical protein
MRLDKAGHTSGGEDDWQRKQNWWQKRRAGSARGAVRSSLCLEHDRRIRHRDSPKQLELLVGQRAAGRVVPELEALAVDFADAVRQLKPDVAWQGVRPEGYARRYPDNR